MSRGNRWAVKWGPLEEGEIADLARLRSILDRYHPVAMMHFAAFAYVGESIEQPLLYHKNNVNGRGSLLRAIIETGVIPVVFSSTCATYGVPEKIPIPEEHPQRPINPYGSSKLMVERMLADLGHAHGLRSIALRYFNAAGADPDGNIGEAHDPEPSYMFKDSIRCRYIKSIVVKWQSDIWLNLDIANEGKGLLELNASA